MAPSSPKCMLPLQIKKDNFIRRFVGCRPMKQKKWRREMGLRKVGTNDSMDDKSSNPEIWHFVTKRGKHMQIPGAAVELACKYKNPSLLEPALSNCVEVHSPESQHGTKSSRFERWIVLFKSFSFPSVHALRSLYTCRIVRNQVEACCSVLERFRMR